MWNTLVFVVRCDTLLQAIRLAAPELYRSFEPIEHAIGTADEQRVIEEVYQKLPVLNFSKNILEVLTLQYRQALVVLPVPGVTWSDWGTSNRISKFCANWAHPTLTPDPQFRRKEPYVFPKQETWAAIRNDTPAKRIDVAAFSWHAHCVLNDCDPKRVFVHISAVVVDSLIARKAGALHLKGQINGRNLCPTVLTRSRSATVLGVRARDRQFFTGGLRSCRLNGAKSL